MNDVGLPERETMGPDRSNPLTTLALAALLAVALDGALLWVGALADAGPVLAGAYVRLHESAALLVAADGFRLVTKSIALLAPVTARQEVIIPAPRLLRPRGLPIGNLTSQFWTNVSLHPLELFIKQELRCGVHLRYCGDLLLFADDKVMLHAWKDAVHDSLAALRLIIYEGRAQVALVTAGFPFVGWAVYSDRRRLRRQV